nr:DUF3128 domain-containing protein [Ipomoea batatas]
MGNYDLAAPVHQMQQYYRLGALDNCYDKWSALFDCLRLKTKQPAEVELRRLAGNDIWAVKGKGRFGLLLEMASLLESLNMASSMLVNHLSMSVQNSSRLFSKVSTRDSIRVISGMRGCYTINPRGKMCPCRTSALKALFYNLASGYTIDYSIFLNQEALKKQGQAKPHIWTFRTPEEATVCFMLLQFCNRILSLFAVPVDIPGQQHFLVMRLHNAVIFA